MSLLSWLLLAACEHAEPGPASPDLAAPQGADPPAADPTAAAPSGCVAFVGDVALGRGIAAALARRPSPWAAFPPGDAWIGNLEGTVAVGPCQREAPYCLGFAEDALDLLAAGPFRALSLANNHALDHGEAGRDAAAAGLARRGITPLLEGDRPTLVSVGALELAVVPVNLAGVDAGPALERARLAVGLARARTPWVVALPHWGVEGVEALGPGQEAADAVLRAWGATLVIGAGAHVPQPARLHGGAAATWFGLGNHLFDQTPPATHEGALVRCCPRDGGLTCAETRTRRVPPSVLPEPVPGVESAVALAAPAPPDRAWERHPWRDRFRFVQRFASIDAWFALHEAWSDLDGEVGLRPYVFRTTDTGFEELWRGSSLARPLVAARLFWWGDEELLCALHRGDGFLHLDPATPERVWRVYRWNGFGFRGVDDPGAQAACAAG